MLTPDRPPSSGRVVPGRCVTHRNGHAAFDQERDQVERAGQLRGEREESDVALFYPASGFVDIRQADVPLVVGGRVGRVNEWAFDVDPQDTGLAGPMRAAQVRQDGPVGRSR